MKKQTSLYTIGFAQKKAEEFFTILKVNHIKTLIDIRQSNTNIYAGFTIRDNLRYFLKEICGIEYIENKLFAPSKELRDKYRKNFAWTDYEMDYNQLIVNRKAVDSILYSILDSAVLLCAEPSALHCHRRLAAEMIANRYPDIQIIHL